MQLVLIAYCATTEWVDTHKNVLRPLGNDNKIVCSTIYSTKISLGGRKPCVCMSCSLHGCNLQYVQMVYISPCRLEVFYYWLMPWHLHSGASSGLYHFASWQTSGEKLAHLKEITLNVNLVAQRLITYRQPLPLLSSAF